MSHLDEELKKLKTDILEMWKLVINQVSGAEQSLKKFDKQAVCEVLDNEKRVDAFELKINMDCENILALFNPLANDLRFVLAVLKINYNLERIGDYAKSIAKLVKNAEKPFNEKSTEEAKIYQMFEVCLEMLNDALEALEKENNAKAMGIFRKDEKLDHVNKNANKIVASLIKDDPKDILNSLDILSIIRKLERVGDQTKNISEEIIFYIEAKQIRHSREAKPSKESKPSKEEKLEKKSDKKKNE
jgi:phosphate transport system protein